MWTLWLARIRSEICLLANPMSGEGGARRLSVVKTSMSRDERMRRSGRPHKPDGRMDAMFSREKRWNLM